MTTTKGTRSSGQAAAAPRMIEVLHPTAEAKPEQIPLADRQTRLAGLKVGFLDNSKANADLFLRRVEAKLHERIEFDAVHARKANAASPAGDRILEELAATCQVVVNAYGD